MFLKPYQTLDIRNNLMLDFTAPFEFGPEYSCLGCDTIGLITFAHNVFWPPTDSMWIKWPHAAPLQVKVLDSANSCSFPMIDDDTLYTLQYGSPLIDAGDPTVTDLDGSESDIGRWGGQGGSTYVYMDRAPLAPGPIEYEYSAPNVNLVWPSNKEEDFLKYTVHRSELSGFIPSGSNEIAEHGVTDTTLTDPVSANVYYKIVAYDSAMNSSTSEEVAVVATGILDETEPATPLPLTPYIATVRPNPFNASTVFEVIIPDVGASPALVELLVYYVLGRRVSAVFEGQLTTGHHDIAWDGTTNDKSPLASGVYFSRLKVWGTTRGESRKIVVLR